MKQRMLILLPVLLMFGVAELNAPQTAEADYAAAITLQNIEMLEQKFEKTQNVFFLYELGQSYERGDVKGLSPEQSATKARDYYKKAYTYEMGKDDIVAILPLFEKQKSKFANNANYRNWFINSAEEEFAAAQYITGLIYEHGTGVDIDVQKAFDWYQKAAHAGNIQAQYHLGQIYETGLLSITQDVEKALNWYRNAAQIISHEAQAVHHLPSSHVQFNNYEIYMRAKIQGTLDGTWSEDQENDVIAFGDVNQRKFDEAIYHLSRLAHKGDGAAQLKLAKIYTYGVKEVDTTYFINHIVAYAWVQSAMITNSQNQNEASILAQEIEQKIASHNFETATNLAEEYKQKYAMPFLNGKE